MITVCRHLSITSIFHVLKILQGNKLNTGLTEVNGRKVVFSATDDKDKGLNGTDGMSYDITGDGKFQSEYLLQL
jgi:hypothetical protein